MAHLPFGRLAGASTAFLAAFVLSMTVAQSRLHGAEPAHHGAPPPSAVTPKAPNQLPDSAVRSLLAAAKAELDRATGSPNQALGAPPDTPSGQRVLRQTLLRFIVRSYEQLLDDRAAIEKLRARGGSPAQRLARWKVDEARAPYSMLQVEALRREVQSRLHEIETITARTGSIDSQAENARSGARAAEQQARQLLERIEAREKGVERLMWERELQLLRLRSTTALLESLQQQRELANEQLASARADLGFLQAELAKTEGKVRFPESDRNTLFAELDARFKALDTELAVQLGATEAARRELGEAQARLDAAQRAATQKAGGEDRLSRAAELAEMRLETAQTRANVTRLLIGSVEMQRAVWSIWYDVVHARDPGVARELTANLDGYRTTVLALDNSIRTSFRYTLAQAADTDRAAIAFAADQDAGLLRARLATLRERAEWQARLSADLVSIEDLLDRWRAEFISEARGRARHYLDFEMWRYRIAAFASALWSMELFTAEDTIEVDGRKITAERSITLGKVISAIIILALGLLLGRALVDLACRLAVRYLKAEENATRLAGKWVFALLAAVLFLLSLTTVKIPFTVFAFLGGAIAIGLGFGMQTLLKNLISGLMLLVERPFRLGDVIEVGSIRGTVTDINVRSSLIRDANGIETLVPNSTFLEQNVTNWTYTSSRVRYSLKIGAAYGSRAELVRELLLAAARHHPLVLRSPEPEVLLDDFGADALMFSLQYWLDIGGKTDSRTVASELRFVVERDFAAAGIVLAYPQRDVHLDAAHPIPVRVVDQPAAPGVTSANSSRQGVPAEPAG